MPVLVLSDERHVANLESLKDEYGIGTTVDTTPELLKALLNVLYVRAVDVAPQELGVMLPKYFQWQMTRTRSHNKPPELDATQCEIRETIGA